MKSLPHTKLGYKLLVLLIVSLSLLTFLPSLSTNNIDANDEESAELEKQLRQIEEELRLLQEERNSIQSQIDENNYLVSGYTAQASQLWGEIQIFQKDIDTIELEIKEIEISIDALNIKIIQKQEEIRVSEENIQEMQEESEGRIQTSYKNYRVYGHDMGSGSNLLNIDQVNNYFKDVKYRDLIQSDANQILRDLAELRQDLDRKQAELEKNLIEVKKEKEAIEARRVELDRRRSELYVKWASYEAEINNIANRTDANRQMLAVLSEEEAGKKTEAEQIRQAIFNNFVPPNEGEYVTAGRPLGVQGCTGLCTGPHLHFSVQVNGAWQDPCGYLPGGVIAGCGWGNQLSWPIQGGIFTSPFGNRCFMWGSSQYCDYHTGADFAGPANSAIYSAHNGWLYYGWDPYGAHYAIVCEVQNCGSGVKTGYWHLQ